MSTSLDTSPEMHSQMWRKIYNTGTPGKDLKCVFLFYEYAEYLGVNINEFHGPSRWGFWTIVIVLNRAKQGSD